MSELSLIDPPAQDLQSPTVTFFVVIEHRLHRTAVIERPYGDSSLVIAHLRYGERVDPCVRAAFPLLTPDEQQPWRKAFRVPPWPADPRLHLPPDLCAAEENVPPELELPDEIEFRGGLYVPYP